MSDPDLIRLLVRRALDNAQGASIAERADLFEAAALVLEGPEADEASATATLLRRADAAQLKFATILK